MTRFWEELAHVLWGRSSAHPDVPDARHLPTRSVAVRGTQYLVHDRERRDPHDRLYVLRLPRSRRDHSPIGVYSDGRSLGRLSAEVSSALEPSLEKLGGAVLVNGSGVKDDGIRLWVDVPLAPALAEFAESWTSASASSGRAGH